MPTMLTRLAANGAGAAAAVAAHRGMEQTWRRYRGLEPPRAGDGISNETELRDSMAWALGLLLAVLVARKVATAVTERLLP
jgi:hypothetical protein